MTQDSTDNNSTEPNAPNKPKKSGCKTGCIISFVIIFWIIFIIVGVAFQLDQEKDTTVASKLTETTTQPITSTTTVTKTTTMTTTLNKESIPPTSTTVEITPSTAYAQLDQLDQIEEETQTRDDTILTRHFAWEYCSSEWTWELNIPQSAYDYFKSLPRPPTMNYSVYVTHPTDDVYINALVEKIREAGEEYGYSKDETLGLAIAFVQSLEYTSDSETEGFDEYPRYPIETLVDGGGDCEDTAILTASLIDALDYGVVLIHFPNSISESGHMAVGVKGGDNIYGTYWNYMGSKYYYIETTGNNWDIGEIPETYKGRNAKIYPMIPTPILTHTWETDASGNYVEINITVENLGSAEAKNIYVTAGFDAGNNQVWNKEQSQYFNIPVGGSVISTMYLRPPLNKYTRIVVQVVDNGYAVDESYSKWFDTYY